MYISREVDSFRGCVSNELPYYSEHYLKGFLIQIKTLQCLYMHCNSVLMSYMHIIQYHFPSELLQTAGNNIFRHLPYNLLIYKAKNHFSSKFAQIHTINNKIIDKVISLESHLTIDWAI